MQCNTERFSVGKFLVERNAINEKPEYQRESGIWSTEKQQLFVDSLFNKFDVPKIYLHDLRGKGKGGRYRYAVIDGKQRLHTIWEFLDDKYSLAPDFNVTDPDDDTPPKGGAKYSQITPEWQERFKATLLDVVLVQNATVDDIEDLFSRLNNGEPLNAAEKRNAMGGAMCQLIKEVSELTFFEKYVRFKNDRYQFFEVAAKLLLIEKTEADGGDPYCDLKKKFLDRLVLNNKKLPKAEGAGLVARVETQLKFVQRVFDKEDPLLSKQAIVPMYYIFVKVMAKEYASPTLFADLKTFLEEFQIRRTENLNKKEEERDSVLIEFGRLMQQGTNDLNSLKSRVSILRRYFLQDYPETEVRDKKRAFTEEEKLVVYLRSGKKCHRCKKSLQDITDMETDHTTQWAHGGPTTLANARAFCASCNKEVAKKVK